MLGDISRIVSGQFVAQLMLLMSLPFITRYYDPEEFGVFAIFSAITWILVAFSTGKVESLIITMKSKDKALELTVGILVILLIVSFLIGLIVEFLLLDFLNTFSLERVEYLSILMPATVFFIGSAQTLRFYVTYLGCFSAHGIAAILNAAGIIFITLGYAIFSDGNSLPLGLILGQLAGHMLSFFIFLFYADIFQIKTFKRLKISINIVFNQIQKISILLTTQLTYALSAQVPILIISIVGGVPGAGAFAMAERVVSMPTNTFGHAVGQVVRHRFAKEYMVDNQNTFLPRKVISITFLIMIIGYGLLIALADWAIPFILGEQWAVVIPFVQIIAVMELFNFVFYSVEDVSIIRNNFVYRMWGQVTQLIILVILYIIVDAEGILLSTEWVLGLICLVRILFVIYDLIKTWHGVKVEQLNVQ